MRLTLLRSTCEVGRSCPNINVTDQGTYVVQGHLVSDRDLGVVLGPGELVVEIPSLLPELAGDKTSSDVLRWTDRGTILVRGRAVVNAGALRELKLPLGETAVEIPISALPELKVPHAG